MKVYCILWLLILLCPISITANDVATGFWVELTDKKTKVYTEPNRSSDIHLILNKGAKVYLLKKINSFFEIQLPKSSTDNSIQGVDDQKYYLYDPSFVFSTSPTSSTTVSSLDSRSPKNRTSLDRNYIRGPRGGCYYINANGNKTYVERSICANQNHSALGISPTQKPTSRSSSTCATSQCTGTTQSGSRCRKRTKSCSRRCYYHD